MATEWLGKSARLFAINLFKAICYLFTAVLQGSIHVVDDLGNLSWDVSNHISNDDGNSISNVRRPVVLVLVLAFDNAFLTDRRDLSAIL